jgi:hypothetical protein
MECLGSIFFSFFILLYVISELQKWASKKQKKRKSYWSESDGDYLDALMTLDAAEHGVFRSDADAVFRRLDRKQETTEEDNYVDYDDYNYYEDEYVGDEEDASGYSNKVIDISTKPLPVLKLPPKRHLVTEGEPGQWYSFMYPDKSKEPQRLYQNSLLQAQGSARKLAEESGETVDIYQFSKNKWVWVDKIYPSEYTTGV